MGNQPKRRPTKRAKKQDGGKQPKPLLGRIEDKAEGVPRVTIEGKCVEGEAGAGNYTIISQPNGQDETIMYPKNVGNCGPLTILCLDAMGRPLFGTRLTLATGEGVRRYSSRVGTFSIVFYCTRATTGGEDCKLEFDR